MAKKKDLLSFLFGESAEQESVEADKRELDVAHDLERLFEAAAEIEQGELQAKKTPLAKALSEFGISDADLQLDPYGFCLATDNHEKYVDALTVLGTATAMHKLAEMGWVVTKPGDDAMTNEPANYRIRFLEITTAEENNREPKGGGYDTSNREEVIKKAQKFATTPMDREDDTLNPVENEDGKMGKKDAGVGKEKDGEAPEGKPKGSEGKPSTPKVVEDTEGNLRAALTSGDPDRIEEFTSTGSMGTSMSQGQPFVGMIKKPKPYGKGTKFKTPSQWTVKQPVVKEQIKRKVHSEGEEPAEQAAEAFLKEGGPEEMRGDFRERHAEGDQDAINQGEQDSPMGEDPEEASRQAYQDMQSDLENGECAVLDDSQASGPTRVLFCRKEIGTIPGTFESTEEALAALAAEMDAQHYWPNIYHVNDHGNTSLIDGKGNIIHAWV